MLNIVIQIFFIFLLIFSPLAYGSVTQLPITIIETVVGLMILFWLLDLAYKRSLSFVKTGLGLPLILFVSLIIFQLVPLPLDLISIISGNTAHLYRKLIPSQASKIFFSLSISPNATFSELFKILTYIGIFFLIINKVETKEQGALIINTIIFSGTLISIFGIIQKYSYAGKVYWFDSPLSATWPFGPFVNRNNFAGYINMVIPLALGYFLTEPPLVKRIIYGFCVVMMSLALFLTTSRAGILVYMCTFLFIFLFSRFKSSLKAKTKTLLIWIFMVFCAFIFFGETKVVWERLVTLFKKETFAVLGHGYSWLDVIRIWQDFPVFGSGLGTFGSISSMYKTQVIYGAPSFTYAHNDWLQLLSEAGLLGFIFMSLFFIFYFRPVLRMWLNRHNLYIACLTLGGMASIFGMLVYSLLDFNLHIPANALLFFIIMGLVYRLVFIRFNHVVPE